MQLGEVFEAAPDAAPPPPRRRRRRWVLPLLALGAVAGTLALHGPGFIQVEPGELVVVTNESGLTFLGPEVAVITGKSNILYVPVAQHAHRMNRRPQTSDPRAIRAHSADGVPFQLTGATVRFALDPPAAGRVFQQLGTDPAAWSTAVQAIVAQAWIDAIGHQNAATLARGTPLDLVPTVTDQIRQRLAGTFTLGTLQPPTWTIEPEVREALDVLVAAERELATAATQAQGLRAEAEASLATQEAAHATALVEARAEAARRIESARTHADERVAGARLRAATRRAEAGGDREALVRQAEATAVRTPFEAQALAARVDAVRQDGPALLDHIIATQVIPQLARLRSPGVAADAPAPAPAPLPAPATDASPRSPTGISPPIVEAPGPAAGPVAPAAPARVVAAPPTGAPAIPPPPRVVMPITADHE